MKSARLALFVLAIASTLYGGTLPSPADYDVYRGKVAFKNFGDHFIGIVLTDEKGQAGGYVHLFRLWIEKPVNPVNVKASSASVEYRGRELVILIPDQQLFYTFVISDAQFSCPAPPAGFTSVRYVGYGLNHEIRPLASKKSGTSGSRPVTTTDICDEQGVDCYFNKDTDLGGGGGGGGCDSGGMGATSCSVGNVYGSCSVSCSSGFYACCNNASFTSSAECSCHVH